MKEFLKELGILIGGLIAATLVTAGLAYINPLLVILGMPAFIVVMYERQKSKRE